MSPVRRRTQAESVSDREQLLAALAGHRQGIRSFLALFAVNRPQVDAAENDLWKTWVSRPSTASATGVRAGLQRLAADAIALQLDSSAASALAGQDPLVHLLSQSGRDALQRPGDHDAGVAHQVQSRLAQLDPEVQGLLKGRYHERLSNSALATRLGWPTARVDARLHWARATLDWTAPTSAMPASSVPEGLLPTLIEDHLAGTIDADSRALLVKRSIDDLQVASRIERQARLDLILGELLAPVDEFGQSAFADRLLDVPAVEPASRAVPEARRSSSMPVVRRRSPVPVSLVGGVLLGAAALGVLFVLLARSPTPANQPAQVPAQLAAPDERPTPIPPPTRPPTTPSTTSPISAPLPTAPVVVAEAATPINAVLPVPVVPEREIAALPTVIAPAPSTAVPVQVPVPVPPVSAPASVPAPVFIKGIHFGGDAVTIDGNRWQSQKQAEEDGLTLRNARRVMVSLAPTPAVDADTRSLLISGIAATKNDPFAITLALPDGDYQIAVWLMENQRANSRLFDLDIGGVTLANLGDLPLGGWATYGPCAVQVRGGKLEITSKAHRGAPMLMGLTIHRTAESIASDAKGAKGAKAYVADFSAGVAKDWNPLSGAWSVSAGNYIHTSAEGIDLSVYDGATWSDLAFSASVFPRYNNAYGLVFGFQDAQTFDALTIVKEEATLLRFTKGVKTQIAQAACQATAQWKWSVVSVTRNGRKVSVTINDSAVFTDIDLGESSTGKIGLYADFCPVDFSKLSVTFPRR